MPDRLPDSARRPWSTFPESKSVELAGVYRFAEAKKRRIEKYPWKSSQKWKLAPDLQSPSARLYTEALKMRRPQAILGSFAFLVLAPGTVAGLVPWWITRWKMLPPPLGIAAFRFLGAGLIVASAPILLHSFACFAIDGLGTPAPVAPPKHLVVTGVYRHVRNPMYVSVASAVLGQALLLGSTRLLIYTACLCLAFHSFVIFYEEPKLRRSFGDDYEVFCAHVPRWIPRLHSWRG